MKLETSIWIELDDGGEVRLDIRGTYVPGEKEIRWPNDRAQPGTDPSIVDVTYFIDGEEYELSAQELKTHWQRIEDALWDQVEADEPTCYD